jgi:aminotransferase
MTGWRLGYIVASEDAIASMLKVHQYLVTSSCSFAQWGGVVAYKDDPGQEDMMAIYRQRREIVLKALRELDMSFVEPGGAFYVFPKIPKGLPDDETFCRQLIGKYGLCFVPGSVFGEGYERYFRICYACSTEKVFQGMEIFIKAMKTHK